MIDKTYYKIVRKDGEKYFSYVLKDENAVEYKLNVWSCATDKNKKKNYHLLVFDSMESVEQHIKENHLEDVYGKLEYDLFVFKCKVENEFNNIPRRYLISSTGYIIKDTYFSLWPEGTIMAGKVMIYGNLIRTIKGKSWVMI